eukprot:1000518-Rhodomonas_salina.1
MVCDTYFSSGQNGTPDQLDPKDFLKMTVQTKGWKPSAEVMYIFLMVPHHPWLKDFACDTFPEGTRFTGNIVLDGPQGFRILQEPGAAPTSETGASTSGPVLTSPRPPDAGPADAGSSQQGQAGSACAGAATPGSGNAAGKAA